MKYFLIFLGCLFTLPGFSQYKQSNHYFLNPAVYNPAFTGYNHYSELHLNRREQWKGIEGAPVTNSLYLQVALGRVSLGLSGIVENNGILGQSSLQTTFSYQVPFNINQGLRFGLSAGVGMNDIDLTEVNLNDPVVMSMADKSMRLIGDFGVVYYYKSLYLGFSIPDLFKNNIIAEQTFDKIEFSPSNNYTLMAKYKFNLSRDRITFEPNVLYRLSENNNSQYEVLGILTFLNTIWIGGSYRQDYGLSSYLGLNVKDKFSIGYSYELASDQVAGFSNGSHELHVKFRLGKKKKINTKEPQSKMISKPVEVEKKEEIIEDEEEDNEVEKENDVINNRPQVVTDDIDKNESDATIDEPAVSAPVISAPEKEAPLRLKKGTHLLELDYGHYVIVGSFANFENAQNYSDWLFTKGYPNKYGYNSQKGLYYVIYSESESSEQARKTRNQIRKNRLFRDAWYLLIE